jgi:regulatory protein
MFPAAVSLARVGAAPKAAPCFTFPVRGGVWHNQGVGEEDGQQGERSGGRRRRAPRPLEPESLDELALSYVARFATSRARLASYLGRKLKERGWTGERPPDVEGLVERLARQGFVDDRAFAEARAGGLLRRGYGSRRVSAALNLAGIEEKDSEGALETAAKEGWRAALRFAERRRIGPFSLRPADREERERALAAMIRAGHDFRLARRIVDSPPGEIPDEME